MKKERIESFILDINEIDDPTWVDSISELNHQAFAVHRSIDKIITNVEEIELLKFIDSLKTNYSITLLFWFLQTCACVWFMHRSELIEMTEEWCDGDEPPTTQPDNWSTSIVKIKTEMTLDMTDNKIKEDKSASKALSVTTYKSYKTHKTFRSSKGFRYGKNLSPKKKFEPKVVRLDDWQPREIPQDEAILRKYKQKQIENQKQILKESLERKAIEEEIEKKKKLHSNLKTHSSK